MLLQELLKPLRVRHNHRKTHGYRKVVKVAHHVSLVGVDVILNALWSHPFDWNFLCLPRGNSIVTLLTSLYGHSKV